MQSLSKNKLSVYSRLGSVKFRRKHSLFRAEGEKCVADTLEFFDPECIVVSAEWLEKARNSDSDSNAMALWQKIGRLNPELVRTATTNEMKELSSMSDIPGVVAIYKIPVDDSLNGELSGDNLYLLLDGIQDPGNLGTIIRTAHWFGISTIFASRDTVDLYNPKTIQATMGSISHVKIHYVDLVSLVKANPHIPLYTTRLDGENIYDSQLPASAFIAMGSEGHGVSQELNSTVSRGLLIPPYNFDDHAESLNVGIATAIVLSEFRRSYLKTLS